MGGGLVDRALEPGQQPGAGRGAVGFEVIGRVDGQPGRLPHRRGEAAQRILEGRADLGGGEPQRAGDRSQQGAGRVVGDRCGGDRLLGPGVGEQCVLCPQWLAVGAPEQTDLPPRQRFTRIPLALAALDQPVGRPHVLQAGGQRRGALTLVRAVGVGGPFRIHLVVDGHERRLPAHGQPYITGSEPIVDDLTERVDRRPGLLGVGQRHPRVLVHAGDEIAELEGGLGLAGGAGDGGRRLRVRGRGQRDVSFAGEQARRRIQTDPSGAGNVDLGPGVQIGEVGGRPRRAVERLHIGRQLHQIAGYEAGRQTHLTQDRHQQPGRIAARTDSAAQCEIGRLHAGFHPHAVGDVGVDRAVERDQEVDGAGPRGDREILDPRRGEFTRAGSLGDVVDRLQVRLEVVGQRFGIGEADLLGIFLDEEVERVDHLQICDQADRDGQCAGPGRKDQPGEEVPEGVLLPVHEVVGGLHLHRVGLDRSARMRRGPEPDHMRIDLDEAVERVAGAMLQGHLDTHNRQSHHTGPPTADRVGGASVSTTARRDGTPSHPAVTVTCTAGELRWRQIWTAPRGCYRFTLTCWFFPFNC